MNDTNPLHPDRLQTLMGHVQDGHIPIDNLFPDRRLYKVLAVFGDDAAAMFMLIGEHKEAFAIFEASQFNEWSFHSAHSSLDGALNEIRDFQLRRIL
jgi:hypothetical protein